MHEALTAGVFQGTIHKMDMRDLRKRAGITSAEMALRLGMNPRSYRRYESGERSIPIGRLAQIATELDATYDEILEAIGEIESLGAMEIKPCRL